MGELEEELKKVKEEAEEAARNAAKAAGNEEDEVGGLSELILKLHPGWSKRNASYETTSLFYENLLIENTRVDTVKVPG